MMSTMMQNFIRFCCHSQLVLGVVRLNTICNVNLVCVYHVFTCKSHIKEPYALLFHTRTNESRLSEVVQRLYRSTGLVLGL